MRYPLTWGKRGEKLQRQHDLECVERACSDIAENDAQCRQGKNGQICNRRAAIPDQARQCKHVLLRLRSISTAGQKDGAPIHAPPASAARPSLSF